MSAVQLPPAATAAADGAVSSRGLGLPQIPESPRPPGSEGSNLAMKYSSDVAFTASVKAKQALMGSRRAYAHMEESGSWETVITPELRAFVEEQTSIFLATANSSGQPYIQHRGGPAGFLHILDDRTLAFADFTGNRQYITIGNLAENPKVHLFLIDFARRRRVKIWGEARVSDDAEFIGRLMPAQYKARAERAIVMTVAAWDVNCPKHIPHRIDAGAVAAELLQRDERIKVLEAQIQRLREANGPILS
jgi:predicted pyridoxine 5'-phosphate oxidase superfamily flavin-nucleotide-binding protein